MKSIYLILAFITIVSGVAFSQNAEQAEKIRVKGETYLRTVSTYGNYTIRNVKNKLYKKTPKMPPELREYYPSYISKDRYAYNEIYKLLNQEFLKAGRKLPKEDFFPGFIIQPNGKILEIDFILNRDSSLAPEDIYLIEKTLKKHYTFKTDAGKLKGADFIKLAWPFRFKNFTPVPYKPKTVLPPDYYTKGFDMNKVKSGYKKETAGRNRSGARKDKSARTGARIVRWEEAYTVPTADGARLIVPFSLTSEIFLKEISDNFSSYSAATFFIVSNSSGTYKYETATYIPCYSANPDQMTPNWSGQVIVENLYGEFLKCLLVTNGIITKEGNRNLNPGGKDTSCTAVVYWRCSYAKEKGYSPPCSRLYSEYYCYSKTPSGNRTNTCYINLGNISPLSETRSSGHIPDR